MALLARLQALAGASAATPGASTSTPLRDASQAPLFTVAPLDVLVTRDDSGEPRGRRERGGGGGEGCGEARRACRGACLLGVGEMRMAMSRAYRQCPLGRGRRCEDLRVCAFTLTLNFFLVCYIQLCPQSSLHPVALFQSFATP